MISEEFSMPSSCSSLNDLPDVSPSCDSIPSQELITYDDLTIVKKINKAKFPVFLTYSPSMNSCFAMKVFPFHNNKMSPFFINEARFAALDHPNIISILHYEVERAALFEEECNKISYTVMELAPYGDYFDVLMVKRIQFDEKLARSYFHQLVEGLEYLHSNGVSHLDLKLENLLLGNNFSLKIADFDQAHIKNQDSVITKGTVCYRAPELILGNCKNTEAADIYSAGILLFLFKSGGILPHSERQKFKGMDLFALMYDDTRSFWENHCKIQEKPASFFDAEFRSLFNAMVSLDPEDRPTIAQIKNSKWYNKDIYTPEEVTYIMSQYF